MVVAHVAISIAYPGLARQGAGPGIVIRLIRARNPLAAPRRQVRQPVEGNDRKEIARLLHLYAPVCGHRKLPEMAIVTAAMRKLLHLIYGVLKNQLPFDPNYGKQFAFTP